MTRADCQRFREMFDDFLSSELLVETTQEVLRHVARCADCRQEIERRQALRQTLKRALEADVPPSLEQGILRALASAGSASGGEWSPPVEKEHSGAPTIAQPRRRPLRWLPALVSAVRPGGPGAGWQALARQAAAVLLVAGLSLALVWLFGRNTQVSAAELLRQSTASERRLYAVPDVSLHRVVMIEERLMPAGRLVNRQRVELWRDGRSGMKARRVFNDSNRLIAGEWLDGSGAGTIYRPGTRTQATAMEAGHARALLDDGQAWRMDFSAEEFEWLLPGLSTAEVVSDPQKCRISYVASNDQAGHRLAAASITLRRPDLRPIEQVLLVERGDERRQFRFTEHQFESVPTDLVASTVFEPDPELAALPAVPIEPGVPVRLATAPPARMAWPEIKRLDIGAEIDILYRLHRIDACLRERVEAVSTDGALHIRATAADEQRRRQILEALAPYAHNPALFIDISVSDASAPGPEAASMNAPQPVPRSEMPAFAPARRYFLDYVTRRLPQGERLALEGLDQAIDEAIDRLSDRVRDRALLALQHAQALERLLALFQTASPAGPDLDSAATWQTMLRDHARAFRHEIEAVRLELQPIFFASAALEPATEAPASTAVIDLPGSVHEISEVAVSTYSAVLASFPVEPAAASGPGVETDGFWRLLLRGERLAEQFAAAWVLDDAKR